MAGHKYITESEAKRIWFLHKKGLKPRDIATAVGRQYNTAYRVIDIFEKAEKGEWEAIESEYAKTHKNLCSIARTLFGVVEAEEPAPEKTQPAAAPDNTAQYLVSVLTELRRNNELLEKLCKAWEVQP